jgi:hypothetical protein
VARFADELEDEECKRYAEIGFVFSKIADLEYEMDEFMLCVNKNFPEVGWKLSKRYPSTFKDKIDFVVDCFLEIPTLRSFGDIDGKADLNTLAYGLEEVFSFRNTFFHSSVFLVDVEEQSTIWHVQKYERKKQSFTHTRYQFGSGYLDRVVDYCRYFTSWFTDGQHSLKGDDVNEINNRSRKINSGHFMDMRQKIWETNELE